MKILSKILLLILVSIFLGSCFDNPNCLGLRNNLVGFSFKKLFDGQADSLGIFGISIEGSDSIFFQSSLITSMALPLRSASSQQSVELSTTRGVHNVLMSYESIAEFESVDCGPRFVFSNLNILNHSFDSVRVINSTPTTPVGVNIEVYRCPIPNLVKVGFRQLLANDNADGDELAELIKGASLDYLPLVFYPNSELPSLVFPLNPNSTTTQITFDNAENGLASISLSYDFQAQSFFAVCGEQNFIKNLQVSSSFGYDIARVVQDSIHDPPTTNVLLLRCPRTNLLEVRFKNAGRPEDVPLQINKVTASYTSEEFHIDELTSVLRLPLDESQDLTNFTIDFESGAKQFSVGYVRTQQTFHEQCDQTLFSSLQILSSDFTTPATVVSDFIQFPTLVNLEIIND